MKAVFFKTWNWILQHADKICLSILCLALFVQFLSLSGLVNRFVTHRSIVEAHDNDAGTMVQIGLRSKWYNDNNFRYYGPLYFRLANTFQNLVQFELGKFPSGSALALEESMHFYLLNISVIGIYLIGMAFVYFLFTNFLSRLLFILFFIPILMSHGSWIEFLFTAHPDHLMNGLVALAGVMTLRLYESPTSKKFLMASAALWGAVLNTKLSCVFFLPGVFMLFPFLWKKHELKENGLRFLKILSLSYFLIGFPQNFDVFGYLKKMLHLSSFSSPVTWLSFQDWMQTFMSQFGPAMALIILFSIVFRRKILPLRMALLLPVFWNVGLLFLVLRSLALVHHYYVMPFVLMSCLSLMPLMSHIPFDRLISSFGILKKIFQKSNYQSYAYLIVTFIFLGLSQKAWTSFPVAGKKLQQLLHCRAPFEKIFDFSEAALKNGKSILATPYTPMPLAEGSQVKIDWEMNFASLKEYQPAILILNNSYYARYTTPPSQYVMNTNSEWPKSQEFYSQFAGKSRALDPFGAEWVKTYADDCSLEIWEKQ